MPLNDLKSRRLFPLSVIFFSAPIEMKTSVANRVINVVNPVTQWFQSVLFIFFFSFFFFNKGYLQPREFLTRRSMLQSESSLIGWALCFGIKPKWQLPGPFIRWDGARRKLCALLKKIELGVPFILLILIASSHKYLLYDIHKRGIVATRNNRSC